jgi:hypothetical protein
MRGLLLQYLVGRTLYRAAVTVYVLCFNILLLFMSSRPCEFNFSRNKQQVFHNHKEVFLRFSLMWDQFLRTI